MNGNLEDLKEKVDFRTTSHVVVNLWPMDHDRSRGRTYLKIAQRAIHFFRLIDL